MFEPLEGDAGVPSSTYAEVLNAPDVVLNSDHQDWVPRGVRVYVSAYSHFDLLAHQPHGTEASGMSGYTLDVEGAALKPMALNARGDTCISDMCPNPAFMKVYDGDKLYVVNERIDKNGSVFQLRMDAATGTLELESQVDAAGKSTCYFYRDAQQKFGLVVNYWDATVSSVHLGAEDGKLGEVADVHRRPGYEYCQKNQPDRVEHLTHRQGWSHAHCVVPAPEEETDSSSRYALYFVPDLGEECIHQLVLDRESGALTHCGSVHLKSGHGPRHFVFHPSNKVAYVVNELDSTVDVLAFDLAAAQQVLVHAQRSSSSSSSNSNCNDDVTLALRVTQTISTVPQGFVGKTHCAEIKVGPDGRFLYVANRFSDTLAVFKIDPTSGYQLSVVQIVASGGKTPRHFSFDPSGRLMIVANTDNDRLCLFGVNQETGELTNLNRMIYSPSPNYVLVVPEMQPQSAPVSRLGA